MKVPLSWIREFVDVTASAEDIGTLMSVRGLPLEGLEPLRRRHGLRNHGEPPRLHELIGVMDFEITANRAGLHVA